MDGYEPDKQGNLFRLCPLAFIDVCMPAKHNHFTDMQPDSVYMELAMKMIEQEILK